jgi:hypothetical protein
MVPLHAQAFRLGKRPERNAMQIRPPGARRLHHEHHTLPGVVQLLDHHRVRRDVERHASACLPWIEACMVEAIAGERMLHGFAGGFDRDSAQAD